MTLREAHAVINAYTIPGIRPDYHRAQQTRLAQEWPSLHYALDQLTRTTTPMAEEWGVQCRELDPGIDPPYWWMTVPFHKGRTRQSCEKFIESRGHNKHLEYRLVRRHVTEPEVIA